MRYKGCVEIRYFDTLVSFYAASAVVNCSRLFSRAKYPMIKYSYGNMYFHLYTFDIRVDNEWVV